ncbi:sensor histidine kinase [Sphingomonas prati]|uniref:C4-dicarboxylate transport sensor protein DctB n=1 Tax=Sphingomonas prati TaxID=1843237 RepID=A0A7W9F1P3_9SPHN|nr:ATP-binding protein [Sphingomonas prati]MBB5727969.1 two-component system C4-dicarboxylate transport sensor histidine kinase DctB [Sphingomonas prati]GGE82268.1 two-component sensor histidine kinase [Sphingomonas prati]
MGKTAFVRYSAQMPRLALVSRRLILPALLLLVLLAFAVGFGAVARRAAVAAQAAESMRAARTHARLLESELQKFRLLPLVLDEYPDVRAAMKTRSDASPAARRLDGKLALLAARTGASAIYAIDPAGFTVAASNAGRPDSFVARTYGFRPYFVQAIRTGHAEYFALGNVSGRAGLFLARRIMDGPRVIGVVVVKVEFQGIARSWAAAGGTTLVVDHRGIVLIASDPALRFTTTAPLSAAERAAIRTSLQFGDKTLPPAPFAIAGTGGHDRRGQPIVVGTVAVDLPGWRLLHVVGLAPALRAADARVRSATFVLAVLLAALAAAWAWRAARAARTRASAEQLKAEVARRTIELSDANDQLRIEVAERERADRRFRAAREELAQANRLGSIGTITAGVAHEINQPVATIRTYAENAATLLDRDDTDRARGNLSAIVDLTARIGTITAELRRYARRGTREVGPVAIADVLDGTHLLIGDRFRAAGVLLERVLPAGPLPTVRAGRVRLEQVLVNLLQNALEAVTGRPDARVRLSIVAQDDCVAILIADNGPGIAPDLLDTLFEPFITGRADGLGLGLGIARDIMTEFGGTLEPVASPLGGAAFRATLVRVAT